MKDDRYAGPIPKPAPRAPKPRRPLRAMSPRRRRDLPARAAVRSEVFARDRGCVGPSHGLSGVCRGGLEVHEVVTRARGGSPLDPANCVALCGGTHHPMVTTNPELAESVGLMRHSWERG